MDSVLCKSFRSREIFSLNKQRLFRVVQAVQSGSPPGATSQELMPGEALSQLRAEVFRWQYMAADHLGPVRIFLVLFLMMDARLKV